MTWVKICGITNLEDALTAVDAGADALGFVFYEKSPRKIDVETAREIVAQLPESVEKVGVFVDEAADKVEDIVDEAALTAVQFHGDEHENSSKYIVNQKVLLSIPASTVRFSPDDKGSAWGAFMRLPSDLRAIVLDSGTREVRGGTGKTFDWIEAKAFISLMQKQHKIVIAGGLNPTNVSEAMSILHPWGVDVASGVEATPGKKDPDKVRAFVAAVRAADKVH